MSNRSHSRTTGRVIVACVAALATVGALAPTASADDADPTSGSNRSTNTTTTSPASTRSDDREVADASVVSLRKDRSEVRAELAAATTARDGQFDKWALNHLAVEAAQTEVNRTIMLAEKARRDVLKAQRKVRNYATEAFMHPPAAETMAVLAIQDADQMSWAHNLLSITAEDQSAVVDELAEAKVAADRRSEQADQAAVDAQDQAVKAKSELEKLEASLQHQEQLVAGVEDRLDGALSEVAALKAVDAKAAAELEAEENKLAEESKALVAGNATERADDFDSAQPQSQPKSTQPTTTVPKPTGPPPAPPSGTVTWQDVTKVGGIWVHKSIAGRVQSLLSAASGAGISLGGGGYRDPSQQIALRQAHCGPTQYDIYEKPASQCTPPTARPGKSMHERGLAIDFKSSGVLITSHSDPAFVWLAAHATSYGFYNLASEPWHWSVNGS